ncbi:hypothetical protein HPB47_010393 [Ixodes persulcatus]|uniref:Uncharacterized protein n=1 Tax=Ixodes persulcatus TaxID=34615 RepID=A0AC60NZG2_IXOPE|nr:hypothetical protein HPB47_010393 [Ixodes persulcatus]
MHCVLMADYIGLERLAVAYSIQRSSAGKACQRAKCVRALTDKEIQELLMNSDSDESDNDDAAQLSDLSSDDIEEEPLPPKNQRRKRKLDEGNFCSKKEELNPQERTSGPSSSGICNDITEASSELKVFESFSTPDIMDAIVYQTNNFQPGDLGCPKSPGLF